MKYLKVGLFVISFSFFNNVFALTAEQKQIKDISKEVGSSVCVNKYCFTRVLQAIAWQESSFGLHVIGDSVGTSYYYKHEGEIIYVHRKDTFIKDGIRYTWYKPQNNKYLKKVYAKDGFKPLGMSSLGPYQIKVTTAMEVITTMKLNKYYHLLSNESDLVGKLITDTRFGALIAANYLKMNYIQAQKAGVRKPLLRAISRYNGGNNNKVYIKHILKKVKKL